VVLFRFFVSLLLVGLGCAYIFQKDTVLRMNAFMREHVFRDAYVLLDGRKIGVVLIVVGLMLFALTLLKTVR